MARALKVFRTPIGFHDAYVAAPTQKAALEAWGSDANLFARGVAEVVTDRELTKEPLAHPGEVIKRLRGSSAEHFAALPRSPRRKLEVSTARKQTEHSQPAKPKKVTPRPSRAKLDAAEQALSDLRERLDIEEKDLRRREAALRDERHALEERSAKAVGEKQSKIDLERDRYDTALDEWQSDE